MSRKVPSAPPPPEENPMDLDDLAPACPLMRLAWRDCLTWAITDPDVLEAFAEQTGFRPALTPLDRMIDAAAGADVATARRFVEWFNGAVWGDTSLAVAVPEANP